MILRLTKVKRKFESNVVRQRPDVAAFNNEQDDDEYGEVEERIGIEKVTWT